MDNTDKIVVKGKIIEAYPSAKFKIALEKGHEIIRYTSGKMRRHNIRVLLGDRVKVELTLYDLERGRIIYRYKRGEAQENEKTHIGYHRSNCYH